MIENLLKSQADKTLTNESIHLGTYPLSQIIEKYIVISEPVHKVIKTYKFGYEVDNPSFEFMRHHIFNESSAGSLKETFYTLNLENAKKFFEENISDYVKKHGIDSLEDIFNKLTQKFLFNLYEIDDNFDVFVAFETMNNRGKKLSDLELLKNRLIYLTTLYSPEEVSVANKDVMRKKINSAWGEIYNQLGKNKNSPLNDDEFLKAHWIMYFKYSRDKGDDYIRYLLDDNFSPKKVFEKVIVSTSKLNQIQELKDSEDFDEESSDDELSQISYPTTSPRLTLQEIGAYVDSLKVASRIWSSTYFPSESNELSDDEKLIMDKINRVKISYFRPLVMACIITTKKGESSRLKLLKTIERFIFLSFRVCRAQSNFGSSYYSRAARELYIKERDVESVINALNEDLEWTMDDKKVFKNTFFREFITNKFLKKGPGFYAWNDLRYFLFEYEEDLKKSRNQPKLGWENFIRNEKDKVSIEHIYPQTDSSDYWQKQFSEISELNRHFLKGSLGNLLPLSSSINSSLQNDDFMDKKLTKKNDKGEVLRNGYSNGSYSELEVAECDSWSPKEIMERGLKLLDFMERRWNINLGDKSVKLGLLHLSFLDVPIN